jgi:hypothetical protein
MMTPANVNQRRNILFRAGRKSLDSLVMSGGTKNQSVRKIESGQVAFHVWFFRQACATGILQLMANALSS